MPRYTIGLLALSLQLSQAGASVGSAHFDPPDLHLELELHRQYLQLLGRQGESPVGPAPTLAKDAYLEEYNIQSGETLWSLSQVLYGDGFYWPRIWAQNHAITNPHLVRPGHTLQFLMGSEDDTPAFRFTEEGESQGKGLELASASSSNNPNIQIPPPEIKPKPVLRVPPSFPQWQAIYKEVPKPMVDDRGLDAKRAEASDDILLRAFVTEEPVEPVGYFLENDTESGLPVVNQYVYIKVKKGTVQAGHHLMIVQDMGKLVKTNTEYEADINANLVQVAGELQVTEPATARFRKSRDRETYDCFRALVIKTTGLALKDFALIPGSIPLIHVSQNGPHGSTVADVIGSERNVASTLFGQGDIVFLNKGESQGVESGQILDLFVNRTSRYSDSPVEYSPAPSGSLRVIRVSQNLATAVVLKAHDSILQGDQAGPVSSRVEDNEKKESLNLPSIQGGEIQNDSKDFEPVDEELEKDLNDAS